MKFLPDEAASDEGLLERFQATKCALPAGSLIPMSAVCTTWAMSTGHTFFTMEYVDGEDLASLLRRIGRLPADKALEIARQLCAGLAAAHAKGVLHRDLKPANIMLDGRGQVVITDFGLAGVADEIRGTEVRSGTPAYMAPEQLAGKEVSMRSDIYALGLVLYEVFTGKRAFAEKTAGVLRGRDRSHPKPPVLHRQGSGSDCREGDPALPGDRTLGASGYRAGGRRGVARRRSAGRRAGRGRNAFAADGGRRRRVGRFSPPDGADLSGSGAARSGFHHLLHHALQRARQDGARVDSRGPHPEVPGNHFPPRIRGPPRRQRLQPPTMTATFRTTSRRTTSHIPTGTRFSPPALPCCSTGTGKVPTTMVATDFHDNLLTPGIVTRTDPPTVLSGMINLELDPQGRLSYFQAIPPQKLTEVKGGAARRLTGTFFSMPPGSIHLNFSPHPTWTSLADSDARMAWTGTWPGTTRPLRVEAAAFHGKPVFFLSSATGPSRSA